MTTNRRLRRSRRRDPRRAGWAWLLVAALLLKSLLPMLAAASAEARGLAVGEVCSIYGVKLAAAPHQPAPAGHGEQAQDHCALGGLAAAAAFAPAAWSGADRIVDDRGRVAAAATVAAEPGDASARWLGWRLHAPPARG